MSEDSLLSQLCNICHINTPKYRCPRCSIRTCSLPCTRKHKTWSSCTGVRDPAAYLTRSQLATEVSFDRDFNFITGIERSLERAERDAENRGIELEHEYMLKTTAENGGKKRKRGDKNANAAPRMVKGELGFVRAAAEAGVKLVRAPGGLSRRKMNHSRVHPKHKCLNWSVEWIVPATGQTIVRPCLETTPLKEAYDRVFPISNSDRNNIPTDEQQSSTEKANNSHRNVYLYLHRHRAATINIVLVPLEPSATLRDVLRGKSVLEFPSIFVLKGDLRQLETDTEGGVAMSGVSGKRRFILEEVYLKDRPGEVEDEDENSGNGDEEEEDYTSSEGSSSEESSDEDESEDGNENEDEAEVAAGRNETQDESLVDHSVILP
ncbi:HIT finger domain protein, putative [Talaromyces stipitatus ATCC 10500]|uniref:Box C/D snoRNA protein 1 n=1 Tax=Talaromyces stipitatus (strain ATCC 10500 / CBS 375.48 / QM 6759 / NRRL 1006) TaxID=441959 RepID=B8MRC4_TALSN|nr:HIT finger domain protein, putative [Talaromyces stipitatus ATCC 10500]EED13020.1 HIT finger domain protein, putative [Talaromyces stipitatus ATCC 10500]